MAATAGELGVDVVPEVSRDAGRRLSTDLKRAVDDADRRTKGVGSRLGSSITGGLKTAAKVGAAALGTLAVASVGMAKVSIDAFTESNQVQQQTVAGLKSTGGVAGVTAKQIGALANTIRNYSGIEDEAIQNGENLLLTFTSIRNETGKGNDIFNQATVAMADLSARMGQDTKASAIQLGKALNNPIKGVTALQRVGVQFTDKQKAQIKALQDSGHLMAAQKVILKELTKEFGGSAKAMGKANPAAILKSQAGDVEETIGKAILPLVTQLMTSLQPVLQQLAPVIVGVIKAIAPVFVELANAIIPIVKELLPTLSTLLMAAVPIIQALSPILVVLADALGRILVALAPILPVIGQLLTALAPLITLVADLAATLVEVVAPVLALVAGWLADVITAVSDFFADWKKYWKKITDFFTNIWDGVGAIISGIFDGLVGTVKTMANGIIWILNKLIDGINTVAEAAANVASGPFAAFVNVPNIPHIPSLAIGTEDWAGGIVKVHQDEIVVLPEHSRVIRAAESRGGIGSPLAERIVFQQVKADAADIARDLQFLEIRRGWS